MFFFVQVMRGFDPAYASIFCSQVTRRFIANTRLEAWVSGTAFSPKSWLETLTQPPHQRNLWTCSSTTRMHVDERQQGTKDLE